MSKRCAREECGKLVYPLEELKCLDKVWHKTCFKCTVCGMALNMKNYKGYNKMPYCEPHYPKTVASVVTDTPEMRRLAENTKYQSQVQYHAEYEKQKGTKIQIADDPEISRHMANTKVQSQVAYTGELAKKQNQDHLRTYGFEQEPQQNAPTPTFGTSSVSQPGSTVLYSSEQGGTIQQQPRIVGSIVDYDPMNGQYGSTAAQNQPTSYLNGGAAKTSNAKPKHEEFFTVRAIYSYESKDSDEVSFNEGDVIVNCKSVDEGWMTGLVQNTSQWGMLPANYVERI
ncbi:unnamed protein product, partial [Mesorhabditis spiculigera]